MNPLVSVIIPFYSRSDWLEEAVESVLNQTYDKIEIIVINDGSKENLNKFLKKYGKKIIYYTQENRGPGAARNQGMKIAKGKYLSFLDSDDLWLSNKTERQIFFMEKENVVWSHTSFFYWFPISGNLKLVNNKFDCGDVFIKYYVSVKIATPSVVIRRDLLIKHPEFTFPEDYRKGQDAKLFHEISGKYALYLLPEPLVMVRSRGNNTNTRALVRFSLKSKEYNLIKKDKEKFRKIPHFIKCIYIIYNFYCKGFGIFIEKGPGAREFIAKCFWTIPFGLERLYLLYFKLKSGNGLRKFRFEEM